MDISLANRLAAAVRAADPDRYFSLLFAPAAQRPLLLALYAFNHEVARVAETVREPMLGAIRLEWWRETVEGAAKGAPRNHDVAKGLAALFATGKVSLGDFESLIAARNFDSSAKYFADFAELETYLDASGGGLMRLAARLLGGNPGAARDAALAYGLTGLLRSLRFHNGRHKLYLPLDLLRALGLTPEEFFILQHDPRMDAAAHQTALRARDYFLAARKAARPGAALPAFLPAALVPLYLKRLGREVPVHRKQLALLSAAMRKKL
jgi:NADH dehydrogenase [ubiquinone] 1 alpha subcomplex assembly factor 6